MDCTVDSMLTTTPRFKPREGCEPRPTTSMRPSLVISPTIATTFEVPMSSPTIKLRSFFLAIYALTPPEVPRDFDELPALDRLNSKSTSTIRDEPMHPESTVRLARRAQERSNPRRNHCCSASRRTALLRCGRRRAARRLAGTVRGAL